MTEHSFLVPIQKCHGLNSVLKILVANVCRLNNSASSSWAWQVCGLLKFQLCMVYGSNFWIKIQSASETVYEAFHFSLKLLGVLSKQLA